ncbi:late competence development ComFB family protein [Gilvimarinus sp. SDUM040013]|uniref:Late competence development ComFB family protein n=1 Tax=Gilvimarinus gilvus TaxID=3058038 RepID=A0ABU4RS74_9GAMM|nr:late competence development ComFB family protein [Gilvimarinus sp. SDUM040013]MDO3388189.1 late competence development ComFB family protein [Gilvimarinus sp. SDUM040013]MDX6847739.1 late competence development ComFB family protein [Gilvimarinus sp. SDUM040013]
MLAYPGHSSFISQDELDTIHNYYEKRVVEAIYEASERARDGDRDFIADVACVALNRLPPRYIRYDVDMTFFTSPQELEEMKDKVTMAVNDAIVYVTERENNLEKPEPSATETKKPAKKTRAKAKSKNVKKG